MEAAIRVEPFYFGPSDRLFGVLDSGPEGVAVKRPIVLCQALGHESIWSHRGWRHLARSLAERGHPVLRFDYSGFGDSLGDAVDFSMADWVDDAVAALDWMRTRFGLPIAIGLRLGASVLYAAIERGTPCARVVLWEPVVSGADYLGRLRALHAENVSKFGSRSRTSAGKSVELVGVEYSSTAIEEIEAVDLTSSAAPRKLDVLHLVVVDNAQQQALRDVWGRDAKPERFEWAHVSESASWLKDPYGYLLPVRSFDAIREWVRGEQG